jgi:hypothetical protein
MVTANVTYPFYGVVVPSTRQITYCRQVAPPRYREKDLRLSRSCLATGASQDLSTPTD